MAQQPPVMLPPGATETAAQQDGEDILPLPKWLTRVYYIFPIVLYIPDAIFNFYVYANGLIDFTNITIDKVPYIVLWAFLATGLVGMAWLLSVLAPWHWARRNYFQSVMCWIGVIIATGITIWNSLAYRTKETNVHFPTDLWFAQTFHADLNAWSPTTVLVAVAPPFWGLFWAIVQPAERKRSRAAEEADFQTKLERMRQEAELKRMKAEANAQIREAQLKGLAATMRAARDQIAGPESAQPQTTVTPEQQQEAVPAERVVALPTGSIRRLSDRRLGSTPFGETTDSGEHEVIRGAASNMSYSAAPAAPQSPVFHAPNSDSPSRSDITFDGVASGEHSGVLPTIRPGMPRASTLLRNYADGEHVMRAVDADVEKMRAGGLKVTIKSFAEYRGIELSQAKQLLARWKEWKQAQESGERNLEMAE